MICDTYVPMYIEYVPNRKSKPTILLREGRRVGKKILKKTLLNITHWDPTHIEGLRRVLKGEILLSPDDLFSIKSSRPHGHVEAVLGTMKRLGLPQLISSRPSPQRDLIVAMIAQRILSPGSKLAATRLWHNTTLAEELKVGDADVDELYEALDWLLARKNRIEKKLARKHLKTGDSVFYDISSSYYEGATCPLATFGYSRDKKKGLPIIVYGLLTDGQGCPVSIQVYPGNTPDSTTVPDQAAKLQSQFGLSRVVLVGDRGMLTQTQIDNLTEYPGIGWVSALRHHEIKKLVAGGDLQMSLFDERNLAEIHSGRFPNERLIACYNPLNADKRAYKRKTLLDATELALEKVANEVGRRTKTPLLKDEIGLKVGKILYRYNMGKHFKLTIKDNHLSWVRNQEAIQKEADLDGIYVIRTGEPETELSAEDTVRTYKRLTRVERAFRLIKTTDLKIRPIFHRAPNRVKAHFFLCMLAYYLDWHMRRALSPLLFAEEDLEKAIQERDPVEKAIPTETCQTKKDKRKTKNGLPIHSFQTLLADLGTRCRVTCSIKMGRAKGTVNKYPKLTEFHKKCFELLEVFPAA